MAITTNSHFLNEYTFTINGDTTGYTDLLGVMTANVEAVIEHLADFLQWNGVLDFVLRIDDRATYGNGPDGPGFSSYLTVSPL